MRLPLLFLMFLNIPAFAISYNASLDLDAAATDLYTTSTLTGSCTNDFPVELQLGDASQTMDCVDGSYSFQVVFPALGEQEIILSQQLNSHLQLRFSDYVNVIEEIDTTPPALALLSPAHQTEVRQTTQLRGQCEEGLMVEYLVGTQGGNFMCEQTPFVQDFVFEQLGGFNFYMRQTDAAGNRSLIMNRVRVVEDDETEPTGQPENLSSGGSIHINGIRVSRTDCTSPCSIMFSLDRMVDTLSTNENPFSTTGVYWNYGDDSADEDKGYFEKGSQYFRNGGQPDGGASRETDTNTPIGMHTYTCESGSCTFYPGVAVMNAQGDWATEWLTVTVHAQEETYPETDTICISPSGTWDGDMACPEGAIHLAQIPGPNEWESDMLYLLRRGESFASSCIPYNRENITITDFGNMLDPRPMISEFGIGHDGSCNDTIPTDDTIQAYTVDHWVESITLANLRIGNIDIGMSFRDITLDNLDMDFENDPAGGMIAIVSADACSNHETLTCANIRTPIGLYISGTRIIGSRTQLPGVNISMMSASCVSFLGIIDTEIEIAYEHNVRLECGSRVLAIHSDLNGNHLGQNGLKHAMTIRPEGYRNIDMLDEVYKVDSSLGLAERYDNRYIVAKSLYLGTPESINNSARITFTASNGGLMETTRYGLISDNISDLLGGSGDGPAFRDAVLQGMHLVCYSDNTWSPNQGCRDNGQQVLPNGYYLPALTDMLPPAVPMAPEDY